MIPLLLAGAAAGAAGGLFGSNARNDAINEYVRAKQKNIRQQQTENENWYRRRYNEDATQRADAKRLLTMTEEAVRRRNEAAEGRRALTGGTEASVEAEKEANNAMYADAVSQVAAQGEARKDAIEAQYMQRKNALNKEMSDLEEQKLGLARSGDKVSNMIGGAFSGLSSFGSLASLFKKES